MNEVDVFSIQNERELYPVGWIHVHLYLCSLLNVLICLGFAIMSCMRACFTDSSFSGLFHVISRFAYPLLVSGTLKFLSNNIFKILFPLYLHIHTRFEVSIISFFIKVMVPEAFAIVVAPTDSSRFLLPKPVLTRYHVVDYERSYWFFCRSYGIFKLTDPGGMEVLRGCSETGFHPHKEPEDGKPVYEQCSNVYKNSNLRFEIFDLRWGKVSNPSVGGNISGKKGSSLIHCELKRYQFKKTINLTGTVYFFLSKKSCLYWGYMNTKSVIL